MNPTPSGPERAEREELARLLPVPVERDLPPGRHLHHKDTLMHLIDQDTGRAAPRQRLLRPAVLLPAAAMALTGILVTTLAVTDRDSAQAPSATAPRTEAGTSRDAAVLLDRIASVAARSDELPVAGDQFVYVKSKQTQNDGGLGGPVKLSPPHVRKVWMTQKPGPVLDVGLIHENAQYWPIEVGVPDGESPVGIPAGLDRPTYAWLASLPTDPDVLLDRLRTETTRSQDISNTPPEDRNADQDVFDRVGELLRETVMPPKTAAALYKAAARIPGVTEDPEAVDAAGRRGIGVARENTRHERTAWIFDRNTLVYLGERSYLTRDTERGRKGTLIHVSAVLERAVVDALREEPTTTA
ncbi:CU044_5270 family protein [Streptomyces sp. NPDC060035]|uniref:CU044_5270 family protein n=1 Tax=Streptomyces sp. NPDC060035 TaxID=3347044 RepID=UPI0036BF7D69